MNYYIYRHIRLDKNIPFYVGIGHNKDDNNFLYKRAYSKDRKSEMWKGAAEIERILGYGSSNIGRACTTKDKIIRNRKKRTAYNFYWEYKNKITTA